MGVSAASYEFSTWGWEFREQPVKDFGIDAHVEPFDGPNRPSGRLIALQLKSGLSYFREKTAAGWAYRGQNKHLRYWLGHVLPVLIILYDPDAHVLYWQDVTEERVEYTDGAWKILVPFDQVLTAAAAEDLRAIADTAVGASEDPVERSLPELPPSAGAVLRQVQPTAPDGTMRLARLLARGREQPRLTVETVLAARPSWLPDGTGQFEAALGAFANEHGHHDLALEAFSRAADYESADTAHLASIAAILALGQGNADRAQTLLRHAEERGGSGLITRVAQAALADHEDGPAESSQVNEVLSRASQEELASQPTCLVALGNLAARRGDLAQAITSFEAAAAAAPTLAGARLELAQALIARAAGGSSAVGVRDRMRAQSLAEEVLADLRRWSGPSEKALAVLLKSHFMIGAFKAVVQLATPESLGGAALDREVSYGQVAVFGAEAAIALGDRTGAEGFADLVKETRAEAFIRALAMDPALPPAERAAVWHAAMAGADTYEQQRRALYQLAVLGELLPAYLQAARESLAVNEVQAAIMAARNDAARGRVQQAVMSLRTHAASSPAAAETLIEVLAGAGDLDGALAECDRSISRFGADKVAHDKLNLLVRAGRIDDADAYATALLSGQSLASEQRVTLRRRLIQNRAERNQWPQTEDLCREALTEFPEDSGFAWGLIMAQANQGHYEQAWSTFQDLRPPVDDPVQILVWMGLHARFGFTGDDVTTALSLISRWPDDPAAGAEILGGLLRLGGQQLPDGRPVLPELDPEGRARFQAELHRYVFRYPDGPLQMIHLSGTDLTDIIRAQVVPHAGRLDNAAAQVRAGRLPLGALAAAARRPYAAMLVEQACGLQYAMTADQEVTSREIEAATQAIGGQAVMETSALALATLLPGRWPALHAGFSTLKLPRPALFDLDAARVDLTRAPDAVFSVSYDPDRDILVSHQVTLADHQWLRRRITELDGAARQLEITDLPADPRSPDLHAAWLTPIQLAAALRLPLWSDDVAVRSIALSEGIPVFGTCALLTVLTQASLIPDTSHQDTLTLARARVVDLPLSPEDLLNLAGDDGWVPGAASMIIGRPAQWNDFPAGLGAFLQIAEAVHVHAPDSLRAWVLAACHGATADLPDDQVPERLRELVDSLASRLAADASMRTKLTADAEHVKSRYRAASRNIP